jgi:general secretion pathway protein I
LEKRVDRSRDGFTLLEVMIALSILAVTFVILLGLRNRDILQHMEARYLTRATLLAQQKISEVQMSGFPDLGASSGTFPEPDEIFDWTETVNSTPFEYARELRMDVGWKQGEHRHSVMLVTFVLEEKR